MLARVASGTLVGIDAVRVDCEVDMTLGLPYFNVVGLPDGAARESKVRVVSAVKNCGYSLPQKRVTVNLAPADLRKEGAAFELPLALGVLAAAQEIEPAALSGCFFAGELSLDGFVRPVRGILPLAMTARAHGAASVMVPLANAAEAALAEGIEVIPVGHLTEAVEHVTRLARIPPYVAPPGSREPRQPIVEDLCEVRGQAELKLAMEVAAAGGHNLLMCGPPGSGKTMLARRLPGILPQMTFDEALEVTKIYSVMGLLREGQGLVKTRPFRAPHHTISDAGLVGGGTHVRPGELSLAHHGVLFLDELPEFRKNVLDLLRQPMEEMQIHLARANLNVVYPCQVMLVAAMNPCPCGWFGILGRTCTCSKNRITDYHNRVSGPLLDRIDINMQTFMVDPDKVMEQPEQKESEDVRRRVEAARERQRHRFREDPQILCNARIPPGKLARYCPMEPAAEAILKQAMQRHGLSARSHDRIVKLARTRADLAGNERITAKDMIGSVNFRTMDRKGWFTELLDKHEQTRPTHGVRVPIEGRSLTVVRNEAPGEQQPPAHSVPDDPRPNPPPQDEPQTPLHHRR